jgi:hypothetical protein
MEDLSTDQSSPEGGSEEEAGGVQVGICFSELEDDISEPDIPVTAIARNLDSAELMVPPSGICFSELEDDISEPDIPVTAIARNLDSAELMVPLNTRRTNKNRVRYSVGPGKDVMEEALRDWGSSEVTNRAKSKQPWRDSKSPSAFAKERGIPPTTFLNRLRASDPFLAPRLGRPALTTEADQRAVADAVGRFDELNRGKDAGRIIDSMHATFPQLTRQQASNHWHHTVKKDPLLTKRVMAEASTMARSTAVDECGQREHTARPADLEIVSHRVLPEPVAHESCEPGKHTDTQPTTHV